MDNVEGNAGETKNINVTAKNDSISSINAQCTLSASPPKASASTSPQKESLPEDDKSPLREIAYVLDDKKEISGISAVQEVSEKENVPENDKSSHREAAYTLEDKKEISGISTVQKVSEPSKPTLEISDVGLSTSEDINEPSSSNALSSNLSKTVLKNESAEYKERKPLEVIWQNQEAPNTATTTDEQDRFYYTTPHIPPRSTGTSRRRLLYTPTDLLEFPDSSDEESEPSQPERKEEGSFKIWHDDSF